MDFIINLEVKNGFLLTGMEVNSIINNKKYFDYSIAVLFSSSKDNINFIKKFINSKTKIVISDESFTIGGVYSYICTLLSLANNRNIINKTLNNKFVQKIRQKNIKKKI